MIKPSVFVEQMWQGLSAAPNSRGHAVTADLVIRHKADLAQAFYNYMLADPQASQFLGMKAVEDRLKPGMERWLERLFGHKSIDDLQAVLAMQRHIGSVHARAEIPVHLVARGMRLLKREIIKLLLRTELNRDDLADAVLRTDELIDIAFEEMSAAFVSSHESGVRVDEAYRMFSIGNNLALEREKQTSALLEWENRLFKAVATEKQFDELSTIGKSAFGLWLSHKASLVFDDTRELPLIEECMRRIDETLLLQILNGGDRTLTAHEIRSLVRAMMAEMEQLRFLMGIMFDRLTDLEVGRDVLTQLFNRRFLPTILKREIEMNRRKNKQFCVMMLDVDWFKNINDQNGHDAGDRVLQNIAGLMVNQVRASDFVFRYGGEEFLVVLGEADAAQAEVIAEKIRTRIEAAETLVANEKSVKATISIGIAEFDGHPDYQRMIDRADKALYTAKHAGRNRWIRAQD